METKVERYTFRFKIRQLVAECDGRILIDEDEMFSMQVWLRTAEHATVRLEVEPVETREALWPLFRAVCGHRGYAPVEMRSLDGRLGPWVPIPED